MFGPKNGLLYVTTELDNSVTIIDPHTLKIVGSVPTGQPESHMLAITRDGRRGYTANVGPGTVSVLDLDNKKTLAVIPISPQTQRISLSVDDRLAFTADQTQPRLAVIDTATNKVTTGWRCPPGVWNGANARRPLVDGGGAEGEQGCVVDLKSMQVAHTVDVPSAPQEVLVRPDNKVAYVSCDKSGKVAAISIGEWKVQSMIDAGKDADGLAWASTAAR